MIFSTGLEYVLKKRKKSCHSKSRNHRLPKHRVRNSSTESRRSLYSLPARNTSKIGKGGVGWGVTLKVKDICHRITGDAMQELRVVVRGIKYLLKDEDEVIKDEMKSLKN